MTLALNNPTYSKTNLLRSQKLYKMIVKYFYNHKIFQKVMVTCFFNLPAF